MNSLSQCNEAPSDNMGQKITKDNCVQLNDLANEAYKELTSESYTVIRTGGWEQAGWRIPTGPHHNCTAGAREALWDGSLAWPEKDDGIVKWRIHMVFDGEDSEDETKKHACGWRVNYPDRRTFWPTRLSDNPEAKAAWWLRLDKLLGSLDTQNYLPLPQGKNIGHLLMELEAISVYDANRVRRLLDCGCNKAIVTNICQITDIKARDDLIKNEEINFFLEPLMESLPRQ